MVPLDSASVPFSPVVVSNRGPFDIAANGEITRGSGGLVTALSSLVDRTGGPWVACARNGAERYLARMPAAELSDGHRRFRVHYVDSESEVFRQYYSVVANQTLWPIQHQLRGIAARDESLTDAWRDGYSVVNRLVANRTAEVVRGLPGLTVVLIHDYHLYLVARDLRPLVPGAILQQFVHIPWPAPKDWSALPAWLMRDLLDGLLSNDLIGFQTVRDVENFMACCEAEAFTVDRRRRFVSVPGRSVQLRDYPISVDPRTLEEMARSAEVQRELNDLLVNRPPKVILRIDRVDPAKNAVAGFHAFARLLSTHPEWVGEVEFWAFLQPSRQDVAAYRTYAELLVRTVNEINSRFGTESWQPIRLELWENLPRALAAYQVFDVLLVNSKYDGMNLVAKEGMLLNQRAGVLVLSRTAGAHSELGPLALSIDSEDIDGTAAALHDSLSLPKLERERRGRAMKAVIREHDLNLWIDLQVRDLLQLAAQPLLRSVG